MRRMTAAAAANRVHLLKMVVQNRRIFKKFTLIQITNFRISFSHHHDVMTLRTSSYTAMHLTEVDSVATINTVVSQP